MVKRVFALAVTAASLAACAQLLGIESVQDDPRDASTTDGALADGALADTTPSGPQAPDGADAPDAASPLDAPMDQAVDTGPTGAALGCSALDGGTATFFGGITSFGPRVVIDDSGIYLEDLSGIQRCSLEGCGGGATVVAASATGPFTSDGQHLYYCTNLNTQIVTPSGSAAGAYLPGCTAIAASGFDICSESETVTSTGTRELVHAVDAGAVRWFIPHSYGPATAVAPTPRWLFFLEGDTSDAATPAQVVRCDLPGCDGGGVVFGTASAEVSPPVSPSLAASPTVVVWSDPSSRSLFACDVSGCSGAPRVIADDASVTSVFADEGAVYWSTPNAVFKTALDGGATTQLATHQNLPRSVVANEACVYWATAPSPDTSAGAVRAVRQP